MHNEQEINTKPLYIPANIKTRYELISGVGFSEIAIIAICGCISVVIAMLIHQLSGSDDMIQGILIVIITVAISLTVVRKNEYNQSVIGMIKIVSRYSHSQQRYKYHYFNKYGRNKIN